MHIFIVVMIRNACIVVIKGSEKLRGHIMITSEQYRHERVIGGRAYIVEFTLGWAVVTYDQPINPKTGHGWQKRSNLCRHSSKETAMWAWLKICNKANK